MTSSMDGYDEPGLVLPRSTIDSLASTGEAELDRALATLQSAVDAGFSALEETVGLLRAGLRSSCPDRPLTRANPLLERFLMHGDPPHSGRDPLLERADRPLAPDPLLACRERLSGRR